MKGKIYLLVFSLFLCISASGQKSTYKYIDASQLNVIGKVLPTSKPFARVDTSVYKFNDKTIDSVSRTFRKFKGRSPQEWERNNCVI